MSADDLAALRERLLDTGYGAVTPPTERLFYSDAGNVVSHLSHLPQSERGAGMTAVGDTVVFSEHTERDDPPPTRLLTLLDLPRPEVLMNLWSLQESNPNGKELAVRSALIRSTVALHNEALQNAIEYGWSYLSRQMKDETAFFDKDFKDYLTKRFVANCDAVKGNDCVIAPSDRDKWGFCENNQYCLGYGEIFKPLKPTLTNILLGIMASKIQTRPFSPPLAVWKENLKSTVKSVSITALPSPCCRCLRLTLLKSTQNQPTRRRGLVS